MDKANHKQQHQTLNKLANKRLSFAGRRIHLQEKTHPKEKGKNGKKLALQQYPRDGHKYFIQFIVIGIISKFLGRP